MIIINQIKTAKQKAKFKYLITKLKYVKIIIKKQYLI